MKICVIGHKGRMGSYHYNHLQTNQNPWDEIVGCDIGDTIPDATAYIIATPSPTHYNLAVKLLSDRKHVLVEKPATLDYHQAQILYRIAQEYDRVLMVGHTERFNPIFRTRLPHLYYKEHLYRRYSKTYGTSLLWDTMIHDLELACFLQNKTSPLEICREGIDYDFQENQRLWVNIPRFGEFLAQYGYSETIRDITSKTDKTHINLLDTLEGYQDSLYYEHEHFLNLCNKNVYNGHARYAIASIGLAQQIERQITDGA